MMNGESILFSYLYEVNPPCSSHYLSRIAEFPVILCLRLEIADSCVVRYKGCEATIVVAAVVVHPLILAPIAAVRMAVTGIVDGMNCL